MKTALFIGRFQPFHLGHASVLQALQQDGYDRVIIGIGSSQYSRQIDNPLTLAERIVIITVTLQHLSNIPMYTIVPIPDIHNDGEWVAHVDRIVSKISPEYTATYTGNDLVSRLFTAAGKPVQPVTKRIAIEGTAIRQAIVAGTTDWQRYVDTTVWNLVTSAVTSNHD